MSQNRAAVHSGLRMNSAQRTRAAAVAVSSFMIATSVCSAFPSAAAPLGPGALSPICRSRRAASGAVPGAVELPPGAMR